MSVDDILLPLTLEKWPILAETLKKDWPAYAQYYFFVQTAFKWKSKEPYFPHTIYCPGSDLNSGIFVAISAFAGYRLTIFSHERFENLLHKAVTETKIIKWTEHVIFPVVNARIIPTVYSIIDTIKQTKGIEMEFSLPGNCFFKAKEECAAVEVRKLSQDLLGHLTGYPIETEEEFSKLDALQNKTERKKLYDHLIQLGGSKVREFLSYALKEIMSDELVCKFTWVKGENTLEFGSTRVANVLYHAAQKCSHFKGPEDKTAFKTEMFEVLRSTKQTHRNVFKKPIRTTPINNLILKS